MPHPFVEAYTWQPEAPGRWRGGFSPAWFQGRGAYGGLVAAVLLRGMTEVVGDPLRAVRTLTVHFCAPAVEGESTLHAERVRAGFTVSHAAARIVQGDHTVALASATFAAGRNDATRYFDLARPSLPPPEAIAPVPEGVGMPVFTDFFEFRFAPEALPFASSEVARLAGYIRPRAPLGFDPMLAVGLVDAFPPAAFARLARPRGAASVDFRVQFFDRSDAPDDAAYALDMRSRWARDGLTDETATLWSPSGTLLARCDQLIALLG